MNDPIITSPEPPKPDYDDVGAFGLSLKGYLTFMLSLTCCVAIFVGVDVPPWLIGFTGLALGSYFRQK